MWRLQGPGLLVNAFIKTGTAIMKFSLGILNMPKRKKFPFDQNSVCFQIRPQEIHFHRIEFYE